MRPTVSDRHWLAAGTTGNGVAEVLDDYLTSRADGETGDGSQGGGGNMLVPNTPSSDAEGGLRGDTLIGNLTVAEVGLMPTT